MAQKTLSQNKEPLGHEASELSDPVSHYVYTFGETDGPFNCEHESDCRTLCWSIYATKPTARIPLLQGAGKALCDEHAPKKLTPGSRSMANIAKACG